MHADLQLDTIGYLGKDDCASCALTFQDKYGGDVYTLPLDYDPYTEEGKPRLTQYEYGEAADSHYWSVLDHKLYDYWADNFYNLNNKEEREIAERLYGPLDTWVPVSRQKLLAKFID